MIENVDGIAGKLGYIARMARSMPPSWDGACVSHVIAGNGGGYIGRVLPGKGVYLAMDLAALGIERPIDHVFEATPTQRAWEQFQRDEAGFDERVAIGYAQWCKWRRVQSDEQSAALRAYRSAVNAISTYDGIISARGAGKGDDIAISKTSLTTVANAWSTLYSAGGIPNPGTYTNIPGGAVMTRADVGALSLGLWNPTAPDKKYLITWGYTASTQINMMILADLLVAAGNILTTVTTAQTVNSVAQTRQHGATLGAGVMMTFVVTTALGATASNMTVSYTDESGNAGASTGAQAMTTSAIVGRMQPTGVGPFMQLASGDYGVRSVQTVTLSASMTAGVVALHLYEPLMFVPGVSANAYVEMASSQSLEGLTELDVDGSNVLGCLVAYVLPNTTSTGTVTGFMRTCAG